MLKYFNFYKMKKIFFLFLFSLIASNNVFSAGNPIFITKDTVTYWDFPRKTKVKEKYKLTRLTKYESVQNGWMKELKPVTTTYKSDYYELYYITGSISQKGQYSIDMKTGDWYYYAEYTNGKTLLKQEKYQIKYDMQVRQDKSILTKSSTYTYDASMRVTLAVNVYYSDNGSISLKETFDYTNKLITKESYSNNKIRGIFYLTINNVPLKTKFFDVNGILYNIGYFDANGKYLEKQEYYNKDGVLIKKVTLNAMGKETLIENFNASGKYINKEYRDDNGVLSKIEYFNVNGSITRTEIYNSNGKMISAQDINDNGKLTQKEYRDNNGLLYKKEYLDDNGRVIRNDLYSNTDQMYMTTNYFDVNSAPVKTEYFYNGELRATMVYGPDKFSEDTKTQYFKGTRKDSCVNRYSDYRMHGFPKRFDYKRYDINGVLIQESYFNDDSSHVEVYNYVDGKLRVHRILNYPTDFEQDLINNHPEWGGTADTVIYSTLSTGKMTRRDTCDANGNWTTEYF